jgi:hypothetical protein
VKHALIDDNFGGLDLSATGYNNFSSFMSTDSVFQRDYFTSQNAQNYLWSYGCGAGSYTSCSGVGLSTSFIPGTFKNVFTSLAGSFFGDWDNTNNFLRAPLCVGSIASFWGGIPRWYAHHFGLGMPIGYSTMITQNSKTTSFNGSENKVHIALMGDPTLTLLTVPPAGKLSGTSSAGRVNLNWVAATGNFHGYNIYRIDTTTNFWYKVNAAPIVGTTYDDVSNWGNGVFKYCVRTVRLDTTGGGSYYNLGGGTYAWINHTNSLVNGRVPVIQIHPNPASDMVTISTGFGMSEAHISISDMTGRTVIEKQDKGNSSGNYTSLTSELRTGMYVITLKDSRGIATAKLQIQK